MRPLTPTACVAALLLLACLARTTAAAAETDASAASAAVAGDSTLDGSVEDSNVIGSSSNGARSDTDDVPLDELRELASVYAGIRASYVDEVDGKRLIRAATLGMLRALDPHSEYYDAATLERFDRDMRGRYAGIGVEVVSFARILQVLGVVEDSPAARAGVLAGDVIETIDGRPVGAAPGDADRLRGPLDSTIALGIRREGTPELIDVSIRRAPITLPSVDSAWLQPGIAHVAIRHVRERSALELRQHLAALHKAQSLRGIVLDLRDNPGGVLPAAVSISDSFLDAGRIVRTHSRLPELEGTSSATPGDLSHGAAIVVLVDAATASAAELIAAALKDNHRARIVGSRTFGKGSVQSVVPLEGGGAIKLTTARYFTPEDRTLQSVGVLPDVDLALLRARASAGASGQGTLAVDEGERDTELDAAVRELLSMLGGPKGNAARN